MEEVELPFKTPWGEELFVYVVLSFTVERSFFEYEIHSYRFDPLDEKFLTPSDHHALLAEKYVHFGKRLENAIDHVVYSYVEAVQAELCA